MCSLLCSLTQKLLHDYAYAEESLQIFQGWLNAGPAQFFHDMRVHAGRAINSRMPVGGLPIEILARILHFLRDVSPPRLSYPGDVDGDHDIEHLPVPDLGWIAATHASAQFYNAGRVHSHLWSEVVTDALGIPWTNEMYIRSGETPLTFSRDCESPRGSSLVPPGPLIRVKRIELTNVHPDLDPNHAVTMDWLSNSIAPALEHLVIRGPCDDFVEFPETLFANSTQQLRSIVLENINPTSVSSFPPSLTSVAIAFKLSDKVLTSWKMQELVDMDPDFLGDLLRRLVTLEDLTLVNCIPLWDSWALDPVAQTSRTAAIPHLKSLSVTCDTLESLYCLVDGLKASGTVRKLDLCVEAFDHSSGDTSYDGRVGICRALISDVVQGLCFSTSVPMVLTSMEALAIDFKPGSSVFLELSSASQPSLPAYDIKLDMPLISPITVPFFTLALLDNLPVAWSALKSLILTNQDRDDALRPAFDGDWSSAEAQKLLLELGGPHSQLSYLRCGDGILRPFVEAMFAVTIASPTDVALPMLHDLRIHDDALSLDLRFYEPVDMHSVPVMHVGRGALCKNTIEVFKLRCQRGVPLPYAEIAVRYPDQTQDGWIGQVVREEIQRGEEVCTPERWLGVAQRFAQDMMAVVRTVKVDRRED